MEGGLIAFGWRGALQEEAARKGVIDQSCDYHVITIGAVHYLHDVVWLQSCLGVRVRQNK